MPRKGLNVGKQFKTILMHRLFFWGIIILVIVLISLIIDQCFYRMIRLFLTKHTAQIVRLGAFLTFVMTLVTSYLIGHNVTRLDVEVKRAEIASDKLPISFDGFKIAQISDFHINSFDPKQDTEFFTKLIGAIKGEQPDIIVFTGDLVTIRSAEAYPFRNELSRISDETGVPIYSILGNHDYADYMRNFDDQRRHQDVDSLITIQQEAGWTMLNNSATYIRNNSDSIVLVGVENIGEPPFSVYGDLEKALEPIGGLHEADSTFTVLLSHNPTHWRGQVLPNTQIDLTLSGHTHAMQFKIGNWSPSKWKYPEWMGLYQEGEQYLYVNTGLGCVGPAVRIGVKPEVTILTLRKKDR